MNILMDRLPGNAPRRETCDRLTIEIGGVLVDIVETRAAGRPAIMILSAEGAIAVLPNSASSACLVAYSNAERIGQAAADRKVSDAALRRAAG